MENIKVDENRLKFFPIMMFAIVMGLSGLTITYQKASLWLGFPHIIGETLMYLTTIIFIIISILYIMKYMKYQMAVKKEFAHPIRINFFAAVSISMLMLAIIYKEVNPTISAIFWYSGVILHFYLTMHTISFWINSNQEIAHSNPAWFMPIVGNVLVPIGGIGCAPIGVLTYFFSVGMFFWIILLSIILNRIIFHKQLAIKFMPTLFILIAPPAAGFISYFTMFGTIDNFAMFLFNIAVFFTLLVLFMYKKFINIKFFISWWAFIFPIAAMAIATMLMYVKTKEPMLLFGSYFMIGLLTTIISIVIYQTIINIKKHNICIKE